MKNTETVKALEAVIETAQAELKRLTQPQEKKVIGREEVSDLQSRGRQMFFPYYGIVATANGMDYNTPLKDSGQLFTTKEACEAFIAFRKAEANLMYACKPFLTEDIGYAYSPCLNHEEEAATSSMANPVPMFLWVDSHTKALEIAEAHKEDLKIYLNFKWEL